MDDLNYNVAVNLKRIRREKGMSLEGMAEQTGVSKSMLAQIEKGIANPSLGGCVSRVQTGAYKRNGADKGSKGRI